MERMINSTLNLYQSQPNIVLLINAKWKVVWKWNNGTESLTISSGAWLALEAQWGPEACAVVEAPALLYLGGAGALCPRIRHRRPPVVHWRRLPVLDALTSGARHPHPLLKAQLLAVKCNGDERWHRGEMERGEENEGSDVVQRWNDRWRYVNDVGQQHKIFKTFGKILFHDLNVWQSSFKSLSTDMRVKGCRARWRKTSMHGNMAAGALHKMQAQVRCVGWTVCWSLCLHVSPTLASVSICQYVTS